MGIPIYTRILFHLTESHYAFDFIKMDWKKILAEKGFNHFDERFFFSGYVRLLKCLKIAK